MPRSPLSRVKRPIAQVDSALLDLLTTAGHSQAAERLMSRAGLAAEDAALWVAVAGLLAAADHPRRRYWLKVALLGPATIVANFPLKHLFGRRRPGVPARLRHLSQPTESPSFPSAHAVSSFTVATVIARREPRSRPFVLSLAALVALSRPYLSVHHPTDVLGGAVLGAGVGWTLTRDR